MLKPELISHLVAIAQLGPRNEIIKSRNIYMHERIYEMASVSIPENPGGRTAVQMMPSECFRLFHIRLCCSWARVANAGTLHGSHSRNVERQTDEKMKIHTALPSSQPLIYNGSLPQMILNVETLGNIPDIRETENCFMDDNIKSRPSDMKFGLSFPLPLPVKLRGNVSLF